jgi:hypothetical protein
METQEQTFGRESVERAAGYVPAGVPMPQSEPQGDEITRTELEDVASEFAKGRDQRTREIESRPFDSTVEVRDHKTDRRLPENETLSVEEASHLVTNARTQQENTAELDERAALAAEIDAIRNGVTSEQLLAEPPPVFDQQPQPVQQPAPDDDWQRHLQDPRILNAVQQQVDQANAQANAAAQAYNQAAINAAESAVVGLAVTYPELQGLTAAQFPTALGVIAKSNPQRAQSIIDHIGLINTTLQRGNEARVAQQQQWFVQTRKQFNSWAATQDAEYEAFAQQMPAAERSAIEAEARRMVLEGSDPQSVAMSWQTSPELRSAKAQRLLFDAARWRLAQRGAKGKQFKPVPNVQRPGSPLEHASEQDYRIRSLNKGGGPLNPREAAALVTAQRAARRR